MAAEASRSTSSPADSYLGSLISLTSKSDIRYEGVLFTINTEEASIGLRNVRSFGTEGRRKEGPQIAPIDKVYEYIVFRGSDIKDLQVKSSPPPAVQTPSIHNDPAIIQSQYSQSATGASFPSVNGTAESDHSTQMSQGRPPYQGNMPLYQPGGTQPSWGPTAPPATGASFPSVNGTAELDHSTQMSQGALPRSPYQGNMPLYQPGGTQPSWGPTAPPTTYGSGSMPPMQTQYQGFYGASSSLQNQPVFLQPPQGMPIPPQVQQPIRNSVLNASAPTKMSSSQPSDHQPMYLPPLGSGGFDAQTTMLPGHPSAVASNTSNNTLPMAQSLSLSHVSPLSNAPEKDAVNPMPSQTKFVSSSMTSYNGTTEPSPADGGAYISPSVPLVTPGQFLKSEPAPVSTLYPHQTIQKDVEVFQSSTEPMSPSGVLDSAAAPLSTDNQPEAPLLPLPSHSNSQYNRGPFHNQNQYMHRGGHGRGRRSELSNSATSYTEDFDFEAMNEKFKKDEVWGNLGKSKVTGGDQNEDSQYRDDVDVLFPQAEVKPVYKKDDFFDTLSSNSFDNGSRNGRGRFPEQTRFDNEAYGNYSRYRGGQSGGRGPGRGGYQRGGYYARGYGGGYPGRSQGNQNVYRAI